MRAGEEVVPPQPPRLPPRRRTRGDGRRRTPGRHKPCAARSAGASAGTDAYPRTPAAAVLTPDRLEWRATAAALGAAAWVALVRLLLRALLTD